MIIITILLVALCISIDAYQLFQSKLRLRSSSSTSLFSSYKDQILRKVDNWACVKNCGACCKLGPLDSRSTTSSIIITLTLLTLLLLLLQLPLQL